jgi:hypothetical protein
MSNETVEKTVFDLLGIKAEDPKVETPKQAETFSVLVPWSKIGKIDAEGVTLSVLTKPAEVPAEKPVENKPSEMDTLKAEIATLREAIAKMSAPPAVPAATPTPAPEAPKDSPAPKVEEKLEEKPVPAVPQEAPRDTANFSDFNFRDVGRLIGTIGFAKEE